MDKRKEAEELVRREMTGTRNDGKTPAWQHPIDVRNVVRELMKRCGDYDKECANPKDLPDIVLDDGAVVGVPYEELDPFDAGSCSDELIETAALLHDVYEDTSVNHDEIIEQFGYNVHYIIGRLTKPEGCRFGTPALVQYFHNFLGTEYGSQHASGAAGTVARIVKCCDRIANLREAAGVFKPYRLERYRFETKMFVIPIASLIEDPWGVWLKEQLELLSFVDSQKQQIRDRAKRRRTA